MGHISIVESVFIAVYLYQAAVDSAFEENVLTAHIWQNAYVYILYELRV